MKNREHFYELLQEAREFSKEIDKLGAASIEESLGREIVKEPLDELMMMLEEVRCKDIEESFKWNEQKVHDFIKTSEDYLINLIRMYKYGKT